MVINQKNKLIDKKFGSCQFFLYIAPMNGQQIDYSEEHLNYINMLEWHSGRCQEILNKINNKNKDVQEQDLEFLLHISKTYYQRQRNR